MNDARALPFAFCLGWAFALAGCDEGPSAAACYGVCGEGTICEGGRCVVAPPPEPAEPEPAKRGKKRKRGKRKRAGAEAAAIDFEPVDDSHVPRFDANETQVIGPGSGSERLPDSTIRAHLSRLEPAFNRCIAAAAHASPEELGSGGIDFQFGIRSSGKVSGVNVRAPANLRVFGIVPCLRKTLYDHRFPAYDGPTTGVDYSFRVE